MIRVAIVEDDAEVQGVLQEYVRRYTRQYGTEFEVTLFADGVDILDDYRAVVVQNVHPVRKERYFKFCPVLPGIPPDILLQYPLYLRVILYDRHPDHDRTSLTTPLWNYYGPIIAQSRRACQVPAPSVSEIVK